MCRRPRVAILSTGDEIVAPGAPLPLGAIYDSNAAIIGAAVPELGGEPVQLGIVRRRRRRARGGADRRRSRYDVVLLSGGTSKGAGDLSYRVVSRLGDPGIVAHGVALKPGKPICLAVTAGKPVVILPGFPTSAIFTFHEFVAPVIRAFAGLAAGAAGRRCRRRCRCASTPSAGAPSTCWSAWCSGDDGFARLPDGQGLGLGHDLQRRRRLHHHRPAHRDRRRRRGGVQVQLLGAAARARRPGDHRQPLRRARR